MNAALPILERRREIEKAIRSHPVVVVCGETGSGKTTQLPQICLSLGLGRDGMIAHTQPRRLAARAVAARVAEELGESLGGTVGVKVRFDDRTSPRTRVKLMTDGVLLAEMSQDPDLRAYSAIIIDEAHERSLNIDFLLGYLPTLLTRRSDLKVIITSATIDTQRFSQHFGGPTRAPVVEVSGRLFPVEIRYRPIDAPKDDPADFDPEPIIDATEELLRPTLPEGDVLVFLPGEGEIQRCAEAFRRRGTRAPVLPLFSRLPSQEQDRIFHPDGPRRVILATNVAETSLTVPRVRYVVDTGLARISRYDPERKVRRLPIEPISQASAAQRSGRCGRVADGIAIRLYSKQDHDARDAFPTPEIRRSDLAGVLLRMKSLGLGSALAFPFLDPPEVASVREAAETLFELGAIESPDPESPPTAIGRRMADLPLEPRVARIVLAAEREGVLWPVVVLAGALSIQDPRERPAGRHDQADGAHAVFRDDRGDFMTLLRLWDQHRHALNNAGPSGARAWCRDRYVSWIRMREWSDTTDQIARAVNAEPASVSGADPDAVHRALLTGLIANAACREGADGSKEYRGMTGSGVWIFPGSTLFARSPKWIIAAELVRTSKLYARTCGPVRPEWIEELAGHLFRRKLSDPHLDEQTGEPAAWERVTLGGIVVVPRRRTNIADADPPLARETFIREALARSRWNDGPPFIACNRATLDRARQAEARLRTRGVLAAEATLEDWFATRLAPEVRSPATLNTHLDAIGDPSGSSLTLDLSDCLHPAHAAALDPALYPDTLSLPGADTPAMLRYRWSPGKDDDGITLRVPIADLPSITARRAAWLVPGWLPAKVAAWMKTLPRPIRAALERHGEIELIARSVSDLMDFDSGPLPDAISQTLDTLFGVRVPASAFVDRALPDHLRLRVAAIAPDGEEIDTDRDVDALLLRLAPKASAARAAAARARFDRAGMTTWDFGDLPASVESAGAGVMYPALIDTGDSVALTLHHDAEAARRATTLGIRRLFAIACADQSDIDLESHPDWQAMTQHFKAIGTAATLRDQITLCACERLFLAGQPAIQTRGDFEARLRDLWGRLTPTIRDTAGVIARVLEPRHRIAHRLSGGTPRLWASSIADLREHAAFLFADGFIAATPWDRLRHFPRYAEAMRHRLFTLREDGSGVEKDALAAVAPRWKRFTAWIATAMSRERQADTPDQRPHHPTSARKSGAPLPPARRAAPVVNVDAGVWILPPGTLTPEMTAYRWALEEFRAVAFNPDAGPSEWTPQRLDTLWKQAGGV